MIRRNGVIQSKGMTRVRAVVLIACLTVAVPGGVLAQGGNGFLFDQPTVALKFEAGYGLQQASSGVFDFVTAQQTLGSRDFDSPYLGGELALTLSEHFDIALAVGYQRSSQQSEFRDWVDTDNRPILQVTELQQIPATATLKIFPFARGRTLGRFAWVPRTVAPFIGGGVGFIAYNFDQYGDFVDFETNDIFYDTFNSSGEAFLARATAGVNISVSNQIVFTMEGRYGWSKGAMGGDYQGFDQIDLDGLQLIGGIAVRF
jgi:hypothetical protein